MKLCDANPYERLFSDVVYEYNTPAIIKHTVNFTTNNASMNTLAIFI